MKERLLKQSKHEHSAGKRAVALIFAGILFLGILPAALVYLSARLDHRFALPHLGFGLINTVLGCGFLAAGFGLGWWANYVQFTVGRGTPIPLMATQQLIIQKPYSFCRNPMALGAIVAYMGIAILIGSIAAAGLVLACGVVLLVYIKVLEEKEMEARFGEAYEEYRKQTPFIIPRFSKSKRGRDRGRCAR